MQSNKELVFVKKSDCFFPATKEALDKIRNIKFLSFYTASKSKKQKKALETVSEFFKKEHDFAFGEEQFYSATLEDFIDYMNMTEKASNKAKIAEIINQYLMRVARARC